MKKSFSFLLAMLVLCISIPWAAASEPIQPMWSNLNSIYGTLSISNGGIAKVTAKAICKVGKAEKTSVRASLQQLKSGTWTEIKSWSATRDGLTASVPEKSWPVAHGYSYRLIVTGSAYQGLQLLEQGTYTKDYGFFK
ncbi:MAG: hypothetical protein HFE99_11000 [Ruminiclostridium sp.]|jgi:hypothetical protein|nr:hypothetical protein [Ruminiclostridium sp.]